MKRPAVIIVLALAACALALAVTLSQAPAPTIQRAAATAYLAAASTNTAAVDAANKLCPGPSNTNAQLKACAPEYLTADQIFVATLQAIKFPSEMKSDVDALIAAKMAEETEDLEIIASVDPDSDKDLDIKDAFAMEQVATNAVERDLGLPQSGPTQTPATASPKSQI